MSELTDDLTQLARLLVDQPDAVEVTEIAGRQDTVLELAVAPDDLGKVIGRQGRTARAMRTLLEIRGDKQNERYELDILED